MYHRKNKEEKWKLKFQKVHFSTKYLQWYQSQLSNYHQRNHIVSTYKSFVYEIQRWTTVSVIKNLCQNSKIVKKTAGIWEKMKY